MNTAGGQTGRSSTFLTFGKTGAGAGVLLYAFAHAGGTASTYAPWSRLLTPAIEVVGVELPGHGTRLVEQPLRQVPEMAREVAQALGEVGRTADRPFAFYGHSLGALVAFEAARLLAGSSGPAPCHLFLGAARAPHLPRILPAIAHLSEAEFLVAVQQRYGGIPAAVLNEPELVEMILPAMRADFAAYENYRHEPGPLLQCSMTAFAGRRDPVVTEDEVAGWADHTTGSFRLHPVPGDHFFLAECRDQVFDVLTRSLREHDSAMTQNGTEKPSPVVRAL